MASYTVTYTADGVEKHKLNYMGKTFSYFMIPDEHGKTSDKKGFDLQVQEAIPNEDQEVIDALSDLSFANSDEIEEILGFLEEYE